MARSIQPNWMHPFFVGRTFSTGWQRTNLAWGFSSSSPSPLGCRVASSSPAVSGAQHYHTHMQSSTVASVAKYTTQSFAPGIINCLVQLSTFNSTSPCFRRSGERRRQLSVIMTALAGRNLMVCQSGEHGINIIIFFNFCAQIQILFSSILF